MSELALKVKNNCFAGSPLRKLDQALLDFSKLQASRNLLRRESLLNFSSQLCKITSLIVDLQTFPKVLSAMEEIEFLASSKMLPTSLRKPCRLRKHESVIKDDKF